MAVSSRWYERSRLELLAVVVGGALGWAIGCSSGASDVETMSDGGTPPKDAVDAGHARDAGEPPECTECVTSSDCNGGSCAQFQGDTFCAPLCDGSGASCPSGTTCSDQNAYDGTQVKVCVPDQNRCGGGEAEAGADGGLDGGPDAGPDASDAGAKDGGCGSDGGPACPPSVSDAAVTGTVGESGGTVSRILFAVAGDTRPAMKDDTAGYPTPIITRIFKDIEARSPRPSFVVGTGDYQFSTPTSDHSVAQLVDYLGAQGNFTGEVFPAMGNHECTGATTSNCLSTNSTGLTENYKNFMSMLLAPIHKTHPYYAIKLKATDGSWTSKIVFVAPNAWDSTQKTWLTTTLAEDTTYTFVIRHEPTGSNTAPGTTPSEDIIKALARPITLEICGHVHDYSHNKNRVVLGNGGAPPTSTPDYGYGLFQQRSDGAIVVDEINYKTGVVDPSFHFVVSPTGAVIP